MRSMGRSDGLGFGVWLAILVAVLVVGGSIALAVYGSAVKPVQHEVEQVVPNDRFPS
jgi:hypothetical protein